MYPYNIARLAAGGYKLKDHDSCTVSSVRSPVPQRLTLVCLLLVMSCCLAHANNIYIAQNATGTSDGTSCASAHPYTFFNNAANWGTGTDKIRPGTTVHLCGVITTFNGISYDYLTFQGSGTSGAPITLLWEPGAMISVPSCGASACINTHGNSHLLIDGRAKGVLQATDNGSILGHHDGGNFIAGAPCPHCEFKNLCLQNLYVHVPPQLLIGITGTGSVATATCSGACIVHPGEHVNIEQTSNPSLNSGMYGPKVAVTSVSGSTFTFASTVVGTASDGFFADGDGGGDGILTSGPGILIHDNACHDVRWCFQMSVNGGDTIDFYNNKMWNFDHGLALGNNSTSPITLASAHIHDNEFYNTANWDTGIGPGVDLGANWFHHDGIHVYLLNAIYSSGPVLIYNNYIHGNWGHNPTAYVFIQGAIVSWYVFNNVFSNEAGQGAIMLSPYSNAATPQQDCNIFNNLFYLGVMRRNSSPEVNMSYGCPRTLFSNNIVVRGADSTLTFSNGKTLPFGFISNGVQGNVYYQLQGNGKNGAWRSSWGWTNQFSTWVGILNRYQPHAGGEVRTTQNDPKLNSDFTLRAGSSAVGIGTNLSSLGVTEALKDKAGNSRPATGAWDAGPYSFHSSASTRGPVAPRGVTASVQ